MERTLYEAGFRADHVERLAAFLAESLGGPDAYTSRFGDASSVVRMHSGNGEHRAMDDEAIATFADAVDHCGLPEDERLRASLNAYWAWATRRVMARYPAAAQDVPADLPVPRWSWDGPVG